MHMDDFLQGCLIGLPAISPHNRQQEPFNTVGCISADGEAQTQSNLVTSFDPEVLTQLPISYRANGKNAPFRQMQRIEGGGSDQKCCEIDCETDCETHTHDLGRFMRCRSLLRHAPSSQHLQII